MKKRINSTGRKSLTSESIDIRVNKVEGQKHPVFSAKLDFTSLPDLDANARIYVEPYARTSSMRFDFGTVTAQQAPDNTALSELDENVSVLFRVKVVDESSTIGKILAVANGIGAGSKGAGSPRRLSAFIDQINLTYDLRPCSPDQFVALLPKEFDRFRGIAPVAVKKGVLKKIFGGIIFSNTQQTLMLPQPSLITRLSR